MSEGNIPATSPVVRNINLDSVTPPAHRPRLTIRCYRSRPDADPDCSGFRTLNNLLNDYTDRIASITVDHTYDNDVTASFTPDGLSLVVTQLVYRYPGYARMCAEYGICCLRTGRLPTAEEFALQRLRRN